MYITKFSYIKITSGLNCKEKKHRASGRSYHLSQTTSLGSVNELGAYLLLGLKTKRIKFHSHEKLYQLFTSCFLLTLPMKEKRLSYNVSHFVVFFCIFKLNNTSHIHVYLYVKNAGVLFLIKCLIRPLFHCASTSSGEDYEPK